MVRKKNKSYGRRFLNISVLLLKVQMKEIMWINGLSLKNFGKINIKFNCYEKGEL